MRIPTQVTAASRSRPFFRNLAGSLLLATVVSTSAAPPPKAEKYHTALLKRPENPTLFDRFYNAWIDEQPLETLEAYLIAEAGKNGGPDLAILARYHLRRGNTPAALEALGKAITALPDDPTLPMERGKILLTDLNFEAARKDFTKAATASDPALALQAARLIGKSFLRENKPKEAIATWDALLAAHPNDEELLEDLTESAAAGGQTEQALVYIRKLIEIGKDPYKKALRKLREGDILVQAGKSDEATATYAATLAETGEGSWLESEILARFEKVFRQQDRLTDLLAELEKLAEAHPRRLLIHRQLAKMEAASGDMDSAIGRFRVVLQRSPGDAPLREEFIRLLIDGGRLDEAAEELEKMIALTPADPELHLRMADIRFAQENPEATLAALRKARENFPGDEPSAIRIASLMIRYDLGNEGETILESLLPSVPAAEALATQYTATKRKPEALELLKTATEGLSDPETLLRLTSTIATLGSPEISHTILESRLPDFPKDPRYLTAYIRSAIASGKSGEAVAQALTLVRSSGSPSEISDNTRLATRLLEAAKMTTETRADLAEKPDRTPAETCLLASLAAAENDPEAVATLFEKTEDPQLIRFHASLLESQGNFPAALAELEKLSATPEGAKASFLKELTELQIRAGKTEEALATLETWKQTAPGDKTPWQTAIRLHQSIYQIPQAIATARQATARFPKDADLAATLAALHVQSRQFAEAEAIYWRLYDSSETPSDQARWAAPLARIASDSNRVPELQEKFRERAAGNRRSLGPILAQIELARVTRDDQSRCDLLLEALRLKPTEIPLRIQVADLEETSGNPDEAIRILEVGIPADRTDRLRSALAQTHIRQGRVLKGLRMLQAISGTAADDPRAAETTALTLARAELFDEAITHLQTSLPDDGDWRTRYLLASMLEYDGRETEAFPVYLTLLDAEGEIPGISPPANSPDIRQAATLTGANRINQILSMVSQNQRFDRNARGQNPFQNFSFPTSPAETRTRAEISLAEITRGDESKLAQARSAGATDISLVADLLASRTGERPDMVALFKKHPDRPSLLEMAFSYDPGAHSDPELLNLVIDSPTINPSKKLAILSSAPPDLLPQEKFWETILDLAKRSIAEAEIGNVPFYPILQFISNRSRPIPEQTRKELENMLLKAASGFPEDDLHYGNMKLSIYFQTGARELWIAALNDVMDQTREAAAMAAAAVPARGHHPYSPWSNRGYPNFTVPNIRSLPLTTIQSGYLNYIVPAKEGAANRIPEAFYAEALVETIDSFRSPVVRAWIAIQADDAGAIAKTFSAETTEEEAADLRILEIGRQFSLKNHAAACRLLIAERTLRGESHPLAGWLDLTLLATARTAPAEVRAPLEKELRAAISRSYKAYDISLANTFAEQATFFGFTDLAEEITVAANPAPAPRVANGSCPSTLGPATFAPSRVPRTSPAVSKPVTPEQRVSDLVVAKKFTAAAREALSMITLRTRQGNTPTDALRSLEKILIPEVKDEILRLAAPGETRSLTRRLRFIELADALDRTDLSLSVLKQLATERPDDATVTTRLAFLLPREKSDQALKLLAHASASPDIIPAIQLALQEMRNHRDPGEGISAFLLIADFLESGKTGDADLSWIAYHSHLFFQGTYTYFMGSLLAPPRAEREGDAGVSRQFEALANRLARAMLLHTDTAEEGFRLLASAKAWELAAAEIDALARKALLVGERKPAHGQKEIQYFTVSNRSYGNQRSGNGLDVSSVGWLADRITKGSPAAEILPGDFLNQLTKRNPPAGQALAAISEMKTPADVIGAWANLSDESIYRDAILLRAKSIPGAARFFIDRIREMKKEEIDEQQDPFATVSAPAINLCRAAIVAASGSDEKQLRDVCKVVAEALFGPELDWDSEDLAKSNRLSQGSSHLYRILSEADLDPAVLVRITRSYHRLGIPTQNMESLLQNSVSANRPETPGEALELMKSFGWLEGVDAWEPFAATSTKSIRTGNTYRTELVDQLLLDGIAPRILNNIPRDEFDKLLLADEKPSFGTLVTAAAINSGPGRTALTARAFTEAAPYLSHSKPERLEDFTLLLPWLPRESHASLHPYFQKLLKETDKERLAVFLGQVEEQKLASKRQGGNMYLENIPAIISNIAALDLDKAVEIFLAAEQEFTESLAKGGKISRDGRWENARDNSLSQILSNFSLATSMDFITAFRFLSAVTRSDAAGRFSFASSSDNGSPLLRDLGYRLQNLNRKEDPGQIPHLREMETVMQFPEDIRTQALLACVFHQYQLQCFQPTRRRALGTRRLKRTHCGSHPLPQPRHRNHFLEKRYP